MPISRPLRRRPAPLDLPADLDVLESLLRRRDEGSEPGQRNDDFRIALVVSGGGMRGGSTGGMARALQLAGLGRAFDVAYGTSSGAFIAASVVHGLAEQASRVFSDDMSKPEFLDLRRLWQREPVMSLDHLIDHILTQTKPIPWSNTVTHDVPLHVIATAVDDMTSHALDNLDTEEKWRLAFRATACVPGFAGKPVDLNGRSWIDGSVTEPLAAMRAVNDGATHVLALVARSAPELNHADITLGSIAKKHAVNRVANGLGSMLQDRIHYTQSVRDLAASDAHAYVMANPESSGVRGFTRDVAKIDRSVELGQLTAQFALGTAQERRVAHG